MYHNKPSLVLGNPSGCVYADGGSTADPSLKKINITVKQLQHSNNQHRGKCLSELHKIHVRVPLYSLDMFYRIMVWALTRPFQDTDLPFVSQFWLDYDVRLGSC